MTVNHGIDRVQVTFDDETLVADAGLLLVATVAARLGLEALIDSTVRLVAGLVGDAELLDADEVGVLVVGSAVSPVHAPSSPTPSAATAPANPRCTR